LTPKFYQHVLKHILTKFKNNDDLLFFSFFFFCGENDDVGNILPLLMILFLKKILYSIEENEEEIPKLINKCIFSIVKFNNTIFSLRKEPNTFNAVKLSNLKRTQSYLKHQKQLCNFATSHNVSNNYHLMHPSHYQPRNLL
jgi:hypothetical protein